MIRGLDPNVLDPLLDWFDVDDFPEPRGAERDHYVRLSPSYTPTNGSLLTNGRARTSRGVSAALRARLGEVVTVLPSNSTPINVNTAPGEVLVGVVSDSRPSDP